MALIYTKSSSYGYDNTLIIEPRSGVSIPFDFGNWTEIRMGMYWTGVSTSSNYANQSVAESITITTYSDYLLFGLKSETTDRHYMPGTNFVGVATNQNHSAGTDSWGGIFSSWGKVALSLEGTTASWGADNNIPNTNFNFYPAQSTTDYNYFRGLIFRLYNSGSANQYFRIYSSNSAPAEPGTDQQYSVNTLRTQLLNATYTEQYSTASWNSNGAALPIPNCWYFWNPYYYNAARISSLEVVKVS